MEPTPLLEAVRRLAPVVEAGASASERERTLEKSVVEALRGAGVFTALVPRDLGGAGLGPVEAVEVLEEVARQDGSAGWCAATAAVATGIVAGMSDDEAARVVLRDPARAICAGGLTPCGRATPVDGGYRVSGRFTFGSGIHFATTVVGGCVVARDGPERGRPELITVCVPPDRVEIHDGWHAAGLEGTGSCDYSMDDVFVAANFAFPLVGRPRRGLLCSLPILSIAYIGHSGFALGVGRRALEEVARLAPGKRRLGSAGSTADRPTFQRELARAEARLRAARLLVLDAYRRLWDARLRGEPADLSLRADVAQAAVNAAEASASVTDFAYRAGGAGAVYRAGVLQRCFRDMHAARQHVAVNDEVWERVGQVRLGLAEPTVML